MNGFHFKSFFHHRFSTIEKNVDFLILLFLNSRKQFCRLTILAAYLVFSPLIWAEVSDVTITDVTTRAFSVVWLSDEPVTDATVRVFSDQEGLDDITDTLTVSLISANFPPSHNQGIVKVDLTGLQSATTVYVQTITTGQNETVQFPQTAPFMSLQTAAITTRENTVGAPLVNDLIGHEIYAADGLTAAVGTLVMVEAPDHSIYPLTAYVEDGFASPLAVVDLNNLFTDQTGMSAEVAADTVLIISEFRGLLCSVEDHKLLRFRKVPAHEENPPITELETAGLCFFADTVCDDQVNILDVQRVLNIFNEVLGDCAFNPDMDIVDDAVINILDVQSVLNRFGQQAPFE